MHTHDFPLSTLLEDIPDAAGSRLSGEHSPDLDHRLDKWLEAAIALARADCGMIGLRDQHSGEMHVVARRGFSRDLTLSFAFRGEQVAVTSARSAGADVPGPWAMPLRSRSGERLGVLTMYFRSPHRPRNEECQALDLLVQHLADCIDDSHALRALRNELLQEQEARLRAETANNAKDEFLAILVHEFRQPLAAAFAAVKMLTMNVSERMRDVLQQQLGQMARLIEDLGSPAQIARGMTDLKCARLDLCHIVHQTVEEISPRCARRHHVLHVQMPSHPVWIHADGARLRQVLSNLLQNAVFYTPPGGEIALALEEREGQAVVRCRDTGVGIPPDALQRIFELGDRGFQPADARRSGIGLAVVRRLVELHGGRICASSKGLGHGSEFVIELPAADCPSAPLACCPPHGTARA